MSNNLDYQSYVKNGLGENYDIIGNYNLFMQCHSFNQNAFRSLPNAFHFRLCKKEELEIWKSVVVEEQYVNYVTEYYKKVYEKHSEEFFRRCLFICNSEDKPVASTFIWRSYNKINTVGWFRVIPEYEGQGLGRAILSEIFKNADLPAYLHTQPTSARAIKLYSDFGFKLITDPKIGYRENHLIQSMPYLQKVLPLKDYANLQFTQADKELHTAANSSGISKF